jgi:hypothetical protein
LAWFITSRGIDIVLGVSESGPYCHGKAFGQASFGGSNDGNIPYEGQQRLRLAQYHWAIHLPTGNELKIDPNGCGLYARAQADPSGSHAMTTLFRKGHIADHDLITIVCVLPEPVFQHARNLAVLAIERDFEFCVTVDFHGVRVPHAKTSTPTWDEFLVGKPVFANRVDFFSRHTQASGT